MQKAQDRVTEVTQPARLCHFSGTASDFTVTSDTLGPPIVGFGAQMNPYLYCHPNWGDVNEANVKDLEAKVIALQPQHVRIFMLLDWFSDHPDDEISKDDPRIRESFIRTVSPGAASGGERECHALVWILADAGRIGQAVCRNSGDARE